MHKDEKFIEARARRVLTQRLPSALYRQSIELQIEYWEAPGEPVSFDEAIQATYVAFQPGTSWGKPWGTTWFRLTGEVPKDWRIGERFPLELEVDLGFLKTQPGFQAEALVWTPQGTILKALEPRNRAVRLDLSPGDFVEFFLEAASNPDIAQDWSFRKTEMGHKSTAGTEMLYQFQHARLALLDREVWEYMLDLEVLLGLAQQLPNETPRKAEIFRSIEASLDALDLEEISRTAEGARKALKESLSKPAYHSAHTVHAVGHAHIDSAWLWPLRETRRKVARTFSNALDLIKQSDKFIFAASSAQQYQWMKEDYPELFERIRSAVKSGRFVPIGGMWIEPDANVPSGESLTRQLLEGKRFFLEEFGVEPKDVWLPDSFGYSGALPQIVLEAGSQWFLSQKLSWSDTNLFPHHSFMWEGIDGSQVFTHFPPADTYNAMLSPAELRKAESSFLERGRANTSLLPFGWGNGGGGPTREMVAAGERQRDLEGSPRVEFSDPERFFQTASSEYASPPVWVGELYLEFHRGTATTQAAIKKGNRLAERLMREVEYWWAFACIKKGVSYPVKEIRAIWQDVLLLQFHDILPGTSIRWVHEEAVQLHRSIQDRAEKLFLSAAHVLLGSGSDRARLNSSPFALDGVEAMGVSKPTEFRPARIQRADQFIELENDHLKIGFAHDGTIESLFDKDQRREVIPLGEKSNLLTLHPDLPSVWDAWDIDRSYRNTSTQLTEFESVETNLRDGRAIVRVVRKFGNSTAIQEVSLREGDRAIKIDLHIDWHENEKFLKLAFPVDLHTWQATSEIQYGHLVRPIHQNTSWDAARFETLAHRWIHIGEPNYGVVLANDSTYGYDITRERRNLRSFTVMRASILRAPNFPDPSSDRGQHSFTFLLHVGADLAKAIRVGYECNLPIREVTDVALSDLKPLLKIDTTSVVVEAVKMAEDGSGDLIIRAYESQGIRSNLVIEPDFAVESSHLCDSLERNSEEIILHQKDLVSLEFTPFQLRTVRLRKRVT